MCSGHLVEFRPSRPAPSGSVPPALTSTPSKTEARNKLQLKLVWEGGTKTARRASSSVAPLHATDRPTSVSVVLEKKGRGRRRKDRCNSAKGWGRTPEKNKIKKVFRFSDRVTRREAREAHTIQKGGGGGCRKEIEDPSFFSSPHGTRGRETQSRSGGGGEGGGGCKSRQGRRRGNFFSLLLFPPLPPPPILLLSLPLSWMFKSSSHETGRPETREESQE